RQGGGRDVQLALAILTGEQRLTRCDAPKDGHRVRAAWGRVRRRQRARRAARAFAALQRPLALERSQVIERRAWRDLQPLPDFARGGRHAVLDYERADERQDLALLSRELAHQPSLGRYHTQRVLRKARKKESASKRRGGWGEAGGSPTKRAPRAHRPGTSRAP